ncbi:MAG: AAA family ATPase, partial [Bacteroidota bacterium]
MSKILSLCAVLQSCYSSSHVGILSETIATASIKSTHVHDTTRREHRYTGVDPAIIDSIDKKTCLHAYLSKISQKAVKSAEAPQATSYVFLDREGYRLYFTYKEGVWEATVTEQIGAFSRAEVLPIVCEGHGDVGQFLSDLYHRSDEYVQRHVHVVRTRADETFSKFVYLGRQGLQGGAPSMCGLATHTSGAHNRKIGVPRPCSYLSRQRLIKRATKMTCFCDPANQKDSVELAKSSVYVGTGDFMYLIAGDIFVDKTLLIKDILTDGGLALLITRPRRWGKTLNMSMLYNFLRCEVRKNETTSELETINPHPGLFDDLNIGKEHPELIASHQGKWPVISLTLRSVEGDDIQTIEKKFKRILAALYRRHDYLNDWLHSLEKTATTTANIEYFSDVIRKRMDLTDLEESLYFLSELLHEYHGQRVFVLLNEYDAPLNNTFLKPILYKQVLSFMRGFLGDCFKDNFYLERGIMTGILRIAKADLFSGINNFKEYSLLDKRYAEHFGFTDAEVNHLFEQPHVRKLLEAPTPDPEDIKAWYNGYTIGGITIYNP